MKTYYCIVLCVFLSVSNGIDSDESSVDIESSVEKCCSHGSNFAQKSQDAVGCASAGLPAGIKPNMASVCEAAVTGCCQDRFKNKADCIAGMAWAIEKRCTSPETDIGKTCCEECSIGRLTGESQGRAGCGSITDDYGSSTAALRTYASVTCCLEVAEILEKIKLPKESCKKDSCQHFCSDEDGKVRCSCREGYRLQPDKKTCKDIDECAEATDDLCFGEDTVCHNIPGSFRCLPIRKREVPALKCPPGFKRNLQNQVCDDINECQLPSPPCPKYLCENTIGGYKCGGKPGKPFKEEPNAPTEQPEVPDPSKNDICPTGFRAGPDDECMDIDECVERLDDCQRLSQYCINTHGGFFCQDHVSKRCAPGFKVNTVTGVCEDIDECEESTEVCKRNEVCVNLPGAYNCKSKISTLPKLASKTCQEGMRLKPGMTICEDIDECREGTHLCDQFQNCINTYGSHECRCKKGYELDPTSGSCSDIDECELKLDNCPPGLYCINTLGAYTCSKRAPTSSTTKPSTTADDYYYDSDEDNSTDSIPTKPTSRPVTTTTRRPTTSTPASNTYATYPPYPTYPTYPTYPPYRNPNLPAPRPTTTTRRPPYTNVPTTPKTNESDDNTNDIIPPPTPPLPPRPDAPWRPEEDPRRPNRPTTDPERHYPTPKATENPTTVSTTTEKANDGFDINSLHCLHGYQRNSQGECVDMDECEMNKHICRGLEKCVNMEGGYRCDCVSGFERDLSGWCRASVYTRPTPRPTPATTPRPTARPTPRPTPRTTTSTTTTTEIPTTEVVTSPTWVPPTPRRPEVPTSCEMGYRYDISEKRCIDINECENRNTCSPKEDCHNVEGGYYCHCGLRCREVTERPSYDHTPAPRDPYPSPSHESPDDNIITVGAQFGRRGPRYMRPTFSRLPNTGAISTACSWGYSLTTDRICVDIDDCAKNVSQCGPTQRCENFFGGYSCQCPAGHKLYGKDGCQDIDECAISSPCPYNSKCINTIGSYRCECAEGFRNSGSNDKVCVDVDECAETPEVCHQLCANAWGGYRCYCKRGYRLDRDNRTCIDVDECAEWPSRVRGRICGGDCINEPGSYRCTCPSGYRLADDGKSCIDINECETGEATCAASADPGDVCQNTRGGYHCHHISCPPGYRLEGRHRCARVQRSCHVSDYRCLQQPSAYSYNFITFVANIYLPSGSVDLFTMRGPSWSDSVVTFELRMVGVQASSGVKPADLRCFDMRPMDNMCAISLLCSLEGPQVAELELTMSLYQRGQFAGNAVARLIIIVSQYEF